MAKIRIRPLNKVIELAPGVPLLEALRQAGIELTSPCGGQGICGKCKILFKQATDAVNSPQGNLSDEEYEAGLRLACQTVLNSDEIIDITLLTTDATDTRILEGERLRLTDLNPAARVVVVASGCWLDYRGWPEKRLLSGWPPPQTPKGLAIDIGTTTLVVTLMDLQAGMERATASALNPQIRFGQDVMSRIAKASTPEGLALESRVIHSALGELIEKVCGRAGSGPREILDVVVGGNTTMLQILSGVDPSPLGVLPFTVDLAGGRTYGADAFGFSSLHPAARVYVPPIAHAYIGSDISAGLLAAAFFDHRDPCLFIDIGTNNEMAFNTGERILVTSTAAGPAFEGMNISCGSRAVPGAIEAVDADGQGLSVKTIDDASPRGICGSGILDTVACMLRLNVIDHTGRMTGVSAAMDPSGRWADRMKTQLGVPAFELADGVFFTQKDVRQFQLAKSAIQTGMQAMLAATGIGADQLKKVIIAGAFGYHLRKESLSATGILPEAFHGELVFAGNTCRLGSAMMLLNAALRDRLEAQMARVCYLGLAQNGDFQERFVKNMWF